MREFRSLASLHVALVAGHRDDDIAPPTHVVCVLPCVLPAYLAAVQQVATLLGPLGVDTVPAPRWVLLSSLPAAWTQSMICVLRASSTDAARGGADVQACDVRYPTDAVTGLLDRHGWGGEPSPPLWSRADIRLLSGWLDAPDSLNVWANDTGVSLKAARGTLQQCCAVFGTTSRTRLLRWRYANYVHRHQSAINGE